MAQTVITITHDESTGTMQSRLQGSDKYEVAHRMANYIAGLMGGAYTCSMDLQVAEGNAAAATGTITFSGVGAANDTILINGVTFTAVASGATGNQYNIGGTATLTAASLASAINASASALVNQHVTAAAVTGVITLTAAKKGAAGNAVTLAEGVDANNHMAESGARLTGGTNATANTYSFGK